MDLLCVSAPGRICLFGEHQDFLGLPVIAGAINLRISISATPRQDQQFLIQMPDLNESQSFSIQNNMLPYHSNDDYFRAGVNVLKHKGIRFNKGYTFTVRSKIPIRAGVSSSSALLVAWIKVLLELASSPLKEDLEELAMAAYHAEVTEFNAPGGMMDQYTASYGYLVFLKTKPPFSVKPIPTTLSGFVLGDSREKKDTHSVLSTSREDVHEAIQQLKRRMPSFDLDRTPREQAEATLGQIPPRLAAKLRANLVNRDITREALGLLESGTDDPELLGALLNRHHQMLSEGLGVSTPKIDQMLEAARRAGAFGGKINGSGGGGTMFAYAPGKEKEVAKAIEAAGGVAYVIHLDSGARIDRVE
jgi:galactokinase